MRDKNERNLVVGQKVTIPATISGLYPNSQGVEVVVGDKHFCFTPDNIQVISPEPGKTAYEAFCREKGLLRDWNSIPFDVRKLWANIEKTVLENAPYL